MPAWEQVSTSPDRGRIAAWSAAVFAAMAAVFSAVLTAVLVAVTAVRRPSGRPSASMPERALQGRETGDYQRPPGHG